MMSRFEGLGVKFDQTYLYREFLTFKDYASRIGPKVGGYKKGLSPRQWGEGKLDISHIKARARLTPQGRSCNAWYEPLDVGPLYPLRKAKHGGWLDRKAGSYKAPETAPGRYLQNTNETFHPAIRYRLSCSKAASLGYDDCEAYDPGLLKPWTKPQAQPDGRIGKQPLASTPGASTWDFMREGISDGGRRSKTPPGQKVSFTESKMGNLELLYLAFYDQDKDMQDKDGSIWKRVIGGDR